jgi:outer membrane protein TolC
MIPLFLSLALALAGEESTAPAPAATAGTPASIDLSLADALRAARAQNPALSTTVLDQSIASVAARRARLDRFTARVASSGGFDLAAGGAYDAPSGAHALRLEERIDLGVPLYAGGAVAARIDQAEAALDGAGFDRFTAIRELDRSVYRSYWTIQGLELQMRASREAIDVTRQALTIIESKEAAGLAASIDVNRSRVAWLNAQGQWVAQKGQAYDARRELARLLHLGESDLTLRDSLDALHFATWPDDPEPLVTVAVSRRPEMLRFDALRQQRSAERQLARSEALPTIALTGSAALVTTGGAVGGASTPVRTDSGAALGTALVWNPFDLFRVRNAVEQAELAIDRVERSRLAEADRVRLEVESALRHVHVLRERAEILDAQVELARENLTIVQDLFGQGSATILDLFDAQSAYRQALNQQAALAVDRVIAEYDLRWAIGEPMLQEEM